VYVEWNAKEKLTICSVIRFLSLPSIWKV